MENDYSPVKVCDWITCSCLCLCNWNSSSSRSSLVLPPHLQLFNAFGQEIWPWNIYSAIHLHLHPISDFSGDSHDNSGAVSSSGRRKEILCNCEGIVNVFGAKGTTMNRIQKYWHCADKWYNIPHGNPKCVGILCMCNPPSPNMGLAFGYALLWGWV